MAGSHKDQPPQENKDSIEALIVPLDDGRKLFRQSMLKLATDDRILSKEDIERNLRDLKTQVARRISARLER